jgi:hypothetical protein
MGFRRTDRLSALVKLKVLVLVTCSAGNHQARFNSVDMFNFLRADREVEILRFRCRRCGSEVIAASAEAEGFIKVTKCGWIGRKKPEPL